MKWPNGEKIAVSIVVNVEEGAEASIVEGDRGMEPVDELKVFVKKPIRNYGNESNYQYGIKAGAPRIMRLLDKYKVRVTWTTAAQALERAPQIADYIRERGHEACSHGWRWVHQFRMDEDEERAFIRKAVASIEKTTGTRPYGWLSRYLLTDNTRRLLAEEGFKYHMDDYSDDQPFWDVAGGKPIVIMPYAVDTNDMKFWTAPGYSPQDWLDYARRSFDWLLEESQALGPRMLSVGLHLRIIGRPGRIWALDEFLRHAVAADGVWITTRREIAERFAAACPWAGVT